jgi:predicted nucleic acid-binding protein
MRPVYCLPLKQERKVPVVIPLYHYWLDATGEAAISVIAYGELLYGAMKSAQPDSLERLHQLREARPSLT